MSKTVMWQFRTEQFSVIAYIEPDYDTDLSWDVTGEGREKLESGEYEAFGTEVVVYWRGKEIAADYLGGSIYRNPRDFFCEHHGIVAKSRADGVRYGCYFPDMVRQAVREARQALSSLPRLRT
jgi:hypothetical protein